MPGNPGRYRPPGPPVTQYRGPGYYPRGPLSACEVEAHDARLAAYEAGQEKREKTRRLREWTLAANGAHTSTRASVSYSPAARNRPIPRSSANLVVPGSSATPPPNHHLTPRLAAVSVQPPLDMRELDARSRTLLDGDVGGYEGRTSGEYTYGSARSPSPALTVSNG
jgi:hypothetical protein